MMKPIVYETFPKIDKFVVYRNDNLVVGRDKKEIVFDTLHSAVEHIWSLARKDADAGRRLGMVLTSDTEQFQNTCDATMVRLTVSQV